MSQIPDAWEDEWSTNADAPEPHTTESEAKKATKKASKAQKRAQQAEFNRQLWAEAEGPRQTNYFLESRNVVPLRQEFKPAPVLLSRKGPIVQRRPDASQIATDGVNKLSLNKDESSDEEEDEAAAQRAALEMRQAQAAKDREEKQRKYEERRLELFGPPSTNKSGNTSPASGTPPQSRSSTPGGQRGGRRGRGGRGTYGAQGQNQPRQQPRELYDPSYSPRPTSGHGSRPEPTAPPFIPASIQPVRNPKGPDGSGRGGFGFAPRGARLAHESTEAVEPLESS